MLHPFNSLDDPMANLALGVDPIITQLVSGQPRRLRSPADILLRPITVNSWAFKWLKFGVERFQHIKTERALRAEITTGDFQVTTETAQLRRFSFATKRDQLELTAANPRLRLRELCAAFSRDIVLNDIETIIKDLLTTVTNYPVSHRLALAGGSEWNSAGGDSRGDIRSMGAAIAASTGISQEALSVFLTEASFQAALDDPIFLAARQNFDTDTPSVDALARYWGVRRVHVANPISVSAAGVVTPMYGDIAIIFLEGDAPDFDTQYGEFNWAVAFRWNRGVALEPFYENKSTTWWFPWEDYINPQIVNNKLAAIITNTAA